MSLNKIKFHVVAGVPYGFKKKFQDDAHIISIIKDIAAYNESAESIKMNLNAV